MVILGIDPGYAILGYGAVEAERGKIRVIDNDLSREVGAALCGHKTPA